MCPTVCIRLLCCGHAFTSRIPSFLIFIAAFTSLSIGFALDLTGYVPNQIQSLATQNSMRFLMCIVPAVSMLLAYVIYRRKYKLNDAYMKTIVAAISGNAQKASDTKAIAADPTEADVLPAEESVLETDNMGALS